MICLIFFRRGAILNHSAMRGWREIYAETAANDGTISGGTISAVAENFVGAIGTNYVLGGEVLVSNLPAGLTASIVKDNATQVTVSFSGSAGVFACSMSLMRWQVFLQFDLNGTLHEIPFAFETRQKT